MNAKQKEIQKTIRIVNDTLSKLMDEHDSELVLETIYKFYNEENTYEAG